MSATSTRLATSPIRTGGPTASPAWSSGISAIPFVDLKAANRDLEPELAVAVSRVADSGWYLLGPELEAFEAEFAAYCGTRHCVGVGSGMSAIELGLRAAGIGPGDEVIVPAYTWIATWLAVTQTGARPVGVDVEEATYNLDPEAARAALTPRTAAIIPVHLRGEPADMDAINELAGSHDLLVLEDAAQAHGARHRGRRVGGLGDAGAFSFYPAKNLGAFGDAGAVTTDDDALAEKVRLLRNYGMRSRYEIEAAGVNSRMAEIQAAVLRAKLPRLDAWNDARRAIAGRYVEALGGEGEIVIPATPSWAEPVWHLFVLGHPDRDGCIEALARRGIEALVHYPVLPHRSPAYPGSEPISVAERLAAAALSLPMHPLLEHTDADAVVAAVLEDLSRRR